MLLGLALSVASGAFGASQLAVVTIGRSYEEGKAIVFDDSFEHEVVHGGGADRFVLYAVLHHPDLGEPRLDEAADEQCAG